MIFAQSARQMSAKIILTPFLAWRRVLATAAEAGVPWGGQGARRTGASSDVNAGGRR